ncbi:endochitinase A-like isoform X5 [Varroa destructor]|uniref:C2HC/C3H-type domain-containing protein n=1 Tax=Varroa destructor TaxID=109461 RepID=A0A7M7JN43_VARDE|nr:endochitinase A-like isoform X5 [Varroa destructor]
MSRRAGGIIPRPSATLTATKGSSSPCPPRPAPSTRATTTTGIVITRTEYSTRSEETLPQVRSSTTTKPLSSKSTLNNVASSHSTRPSKDAAAKSGGKPIFSSTRTSTLPGTNGNTSISKTSASRPTPTRTVRTTANGPSVPIRPSRAMDSSTTFSVQPSRDSPSRTSVRGGTAISSSSSYHNGPALRTKASKSNSGSATSKSRATLPNPLSKKSNNMPLNEVLPPEERPIPPECVRCDICKRGFLPERLDKHREVCRKIENRPRKVFNAIKMRTAGTEQESYIRTGAHKKDVPVKKSNWRAKHEEFLRNIREAKKIQYYLANGGKLSDLPPPPPSENPDYVQCPHCGRKFNEGAAERHIPKCANILSNKKKSPVNASAVAGKKR